MIAATLSAPGRQQPRLMLTSPILTMTGIRKSFGDVQALRGVDVTVYPGEVFGIVGESGSGKSTLLRMMNLEETPDAGRYNLALPGREDLDLFTLDRFDRRMLRVLDIDEAAVKRLAEPAEIADMVTWLCGPTAGMANGSSFTLDVLRGNRAVWWSALALIALQLIYTYVPFMNVLFESRPLEPSAWILPLVLSAVIFVAVEALKAVLRSRASRPAKAPYCEIRSL